MSARFIGVDNRKILLGDLQDLSYHFENESDKMQTRSHQSL